VLVFVAHDFTNPPLKNFRRAFDQLEEKYSVDFVFADAAHQARHLLDDIEQMIANSDACLFDVSSMNNNVFLELGFARGRGKDHYILFRPSAGLASKLGFRAGYAEVPIDIRGLRQIRYRSERSLRLQLDELLRDLLENPRGAGAQGLLAAQVENALSRPQGLTTKELAARLRIGQPLAAGIVKSLMRSGRIARYSGNGPATRYRKIAVAGPLPAAE
jgi:hypothetical protein